MHELLFALLLSALDRVRACTRLLVNRLGIEHVREYPPPLTGNNTNPMMVSSDGTAERKHVRVPEPSEEAHRKDAEWGVSDFIGKFHLSKMTTPHPIPGTATRVEQERNVLIEKRASSLKNALDKIEARRRLRVRGRTRKAAVTARVEIKATVGYRIDAGAWFRRINHCELCMCTHVVKT